MFSAVAIPKENGLGAVSDGYGLRTVSRGFPLFGNPWPTLPQRFKRVIQFSGPNPNAEVSDGRSPDRGP